MRPRLQRSPNILRRLRPPRRIAQIIKNPVIPTLQPLLLPRPRLAGNDIDIRGNLVAESLQWQIIRVVSKRILNFSANGGDAEDYVGAEDGAGDRDPAQCVPELEGESEHVDPGYLADGNGVGDGKGGVEDAFGAGEDFVHGGQVAHD